MAYRAACALSSSRAASSPASPAEAPPPSFGVVAVGGDVPPELDSGRLSEIARAFVGRGARDEWYTDAKRAADLTRLGEAGVAIEAPVFDAAHEWTDDVSRSAGVFLDRFVD
jgi:hypothetical protein